MSRFFAVFSILSFFFISPVQARNAELTGKCTCKKGSGVLATYSSSACVKDDHNGCTTVKVQCVNDHAAACRALGGTIQQSADRCTGYDIKC